MAVKFDPQLLETYTIAQLALWAGDFDRSMELYSKASMQRIMSRDDDFFEIVERDLEDITDSNTILKVAARKRFNQMLKKRKEFANIRQLLPPSTEAVKDTPLVLETRNLRGTVWRLGNREFSLFAYVKKTDWLKDMLAHAREISGNSPFGRESVPDNEPADDLPIFDGQEYGWIVPGNPFIQVFASEWGMVQAHAWWTDGRLPVDAEEITAKFESIMKQLDRD